MQNPKTHIQTNGIVIESMNIMSSMSKPFSCPPPASCHIWVHCWWPTTRSKALPCSLLFLVSINFLPTQSHPPAQGAESCGGVLPGDLPQPLAMVLGTLLGEDLLGQGGPRGASSFNSFVMLWIDLALASPRLVSPATSAFALLPSYPSPGEVENPPVLLS